MFEVIITKGELYDKCENIEQLYDKFYYPLLVEYKELKKQFEEWKKLLNKFKIQQKEFIKYLENMLDDENDIFSVVRVKDILQKYKKIIEVSDERN